MNIFCHVMFTLDTIVHRKPEFLLHYKCSVLTRFMICCDRCEEWFHGDCVGITEARGRLMERNGEDYICPNCHAKKNQVVRPATSILSASTEIGKLKTDAPPAASALALVSAATAANISGVNFTQSAVQAPPPSTTSTGTEEKAAEDLGIKGRIEKATNPTGKKRIKIFQPVGQNCVIKSRSIKSLSELLSCCCQMLSTACSDVAIYWFSKCLSYTECLFLTVKVSFSAK